MSVFQPRTDVKVKLIGEDGNIFNLMGIAAKALKRAGYREEAENLVSEIQEEARDYNAALRIIMEYVHVH